MEENVQKGQKKVIKRGFYTGNQFWKLRAKHGRDRLFASPKKLLEAAYEYFQWCEDNPLIAIEYYGKDAQRCEVPKMRAFTIHGLCIYLDCNSLYFSQFEADLKQKTDQISKDFAIVCSHIREIIYSQKFAGAAAGFLNHNIIARDLGLKDSVKTDLQTLDKEGNPTNPSPNILINLAPEKLSQIEQLLREGD